MGIQSGEATDAVTDSGPLSAASRRLVHPAGEGRKSVAYLPRIRSSNAARATLAPSPIPMMICLNGDVVTSPAA